jgi:hypothetical protein
LRIEKGNLRIVNNAVRDKSFAFAVRAVKLYRLNKRLVALVAVLLSLVIFSIGVFAWMAASDSKDNNQRVADLKGAVSDTYVVTNQSNQPAVARVMVLTIVTLTDGSTVHLIPNNDVVTGGVLAVDWQDGGDGYCYYKGIFAQSGAAGDTKAVFTTAPALKADPPGDYAGATVTIRLKAEFSGTGIYGGGTKYAHRDAWWGGSAPTNAPLDEIDAALKSAIDASYLLN